MSDVVILGIGWTPPRPISPEVSYREMIHEAAVRAYRDAGISPDEIGTFVTCAEDFNEGTSIFDEYTPDQLGAVLKPVHTVGGDGLHGVADAMMQIRTGMFDVAVVEAHSKASNLLTKAGVLDYALDPVLQRPLGTDPEFVAGLEMSAWQAATGTSAADCAGVAVKNRGNALDNAHGAHGAALTIEDVLASEPTCAPLTRLQHAPFSDMAAVVVLGSARRAKKAKRPPVRLLGAGWGNGAPSLESRDWVGADYARASAARALKQAGIRDVRKGIDLFEVDDTYAFKELQHLEALGLYRPGRAGPATRAGETARDGRHPVNPSGGSLGMGQMMEGTGLFRVVEAVRQLRGEAGGAQVKGAQTALILSWRGVPTTSGACAILGV